MSVELEFGDGDIRLSVSDDGIGLPDDYAERGHGFTNMSRDAERLGGRLTVEPRGNHGRGNHNLRNTVGAGLKRRWRCHQASAQG